jgi:hypothetical protein
VYGAAPDDARAVGGGLVRRVQLYSGGPISLAVSCEALVLAVVAGLDVSYGQYAGDPIRRPGGIVDVVPGQEVTHIGQILYKKPSQPMLVHVDLTGMLWKMYWDFTYEKCGMEVSLRGLFFQPCVYIPKGSSTFLACPISA